MAEQTFRSPGFFEQEIDLSQRQSTPSGTPAGVIGTAKMGPAFVPVTVGSIADFQNKFGKMDASQFGPYAVNEFLKHRNSLTYMRVLGAGANKTSADIGNTDVHGTVKNAGFVISASGGDVARDDTFYPKEHAAIYSNGRATGAVQFICAKHFLSASGETVGFPMFTDNDSFVQRLTGDDTDVVNLVRGMVLMSSASRMMIADDSDRDFAALDRDPGNGQGPRSNNYGLDDFAVPNFSSATDYTFKIIISSSIGAGFASDDGAPGFRIISASLDPASDKYISKVLNTDPTKFDLHQHLLYADFAVENELAPVAQSSTEADHAIYPVAILSGSDLTPGSTGNMKQRFGRFDTRYKTARTTKFISQPFGNIEYDLFHFEALSDGAFANDQYKISIANLRASTDPRNEYGTFEVQVRAFSDTDMNTEILEIFPECNLDPKSDRYIARVIGDKKVFYDFDAEQDEERRLVIQGKFANVSSYVRVIMTDLVDKGEAPEEALPFGFRGIPTLKTTESLTDSSNTRLTGSNGPIGNAVAAGDLDRMAGFVAGARGSTPGQFTSAAGNYAAALTGSIVPPLPFRYKATRGAVDSSPSFAGEPGLRERADSRLYWGVKTTRMPTEASVAGAVLNANISSSPNPLVAAYTKMIGIEKLDNLVTGSAADDFNNNKFTLARVALYNTLPLSSVSGSAKQHMVQSAYIRNAVPSSINYTVEDPFDPSRQRITMATLVQSSSVVFNRFTQYAKFTNIFYGGFDGLNILDVDNLRMNDKASSSDTGGKASEGYIDTGLFAGNVAGTGKDNNVSFAYQEAAKIMTDPMTVNTNILAIPGIRDSFITDAAAEGVEDNAMIMYVMDIPQYDENGNRLFDDRASTLKPDVRETSEQLESRTFDNSYTATYFPDVKITDDETGRSIMVPPSVSALGALAFNDSVGFPWFAPAGFNRGALDSVNQVDVRLTSADRDTLYDARINPIASFPNGGGSPTFVIFGQKTLQLAKSALDRVNVRRMLLEVKRLIVRVAERLLFEPNTPATRAQFVGQIIPLLALVQAQQGIDSFRVICDDTNNSQADVEANKLNGRIELVPTRTIEFISIDFIVTNSGVSFE